MENLSEQQAGAVSKVMFPNPEFTTVWSFPVRGAWATHNNKYRGNFAPQLARNIIEMYSEPGEVVLDPMAGGGTTLIEAKLLGRRFIGADINPAAVKLCEEATQFRIENLECRNQNSEGAEIKNQKANIKMKEGKSSKQMDSRFRGNDNVGYSVAQGNNPKQDASADMERPLSTGFFHFIFIFISGFL
jgi:hypothetical protein